MNSTLAHEAGHMLLHGHLFALQRRAGTRSLFEDDLDEERQTILCRPGTVGFSRLSQWAPTVTMEGGGSSKPTRSSVFSFYPVSW